MNPCPCGSNKHYLACCGLYLGGKACPQTPEALMRSRYTAYAMANTHYIKKTMKGLPMLNFNEQEAISWAKSVTWVGLTILHAQAVNSGEKNGYVEFIANYLEKNMLKNIHELSQFQYIQGCWFYVEGTLKPHSKHIKIAPNATCPCGSQKKFKHCHSRK
ncbi:MAG: SEC-C domain-containing protein [Gammaproteobacteria bacterium]|nr:SEC-C domain-containing protein [Gammaproteobacteria bacterium]